MICIPANIEKLSGVAKTICESYGSISSNKRHKLKVGSCFVKEGNSTIFFLVTKKHTSDTPSYENFENCLKDLRENCNKLKIKMLAFPKYGAGLDKLDWNIIKELLNRVLTKEIQCTVYLNNEAFSKVELEENLDINSKIKKLQKQDKFTKELIEASLNKKNQKGFVLEDGILLKLRKSKHNKIFKQLVVPDSIKQDVLKLCHDNFTGAHLGEKKTWIKLNNRFYWEDSYKETVQYVKSCSVCACVKDPPPSRANLKPILDFEKPFDKVGVDILELSTTNSGNKYVVVFTDYLSKWVEAFPLKNQKAETIAKIFINEIVTRHSAPRELLSDQGANFMSKLVKDVCKYFEINKINTTPYNPKCDGLTERFNKTLCKMLAVYSDSNQTNWDLYLPLVLFAYRTSQQTTTGSSPFELLYGREPRLPSDLDNFNNYQSSSFIDDINYGWKEAKRQILKQATISKTRYDSKYTSKPTEYEVGDEVRIKQPQTKIGLKKKLRKDIWSEPRKITRVISPENVEINNKKVVNVNNIKKKEPTREIIRSSDTITRFGRKSKHRFKRHES